MGLTQSSTKKYSTISRFPNIKTRIDKMFDTHKNSLYTEGSIKTFDLDNLDKVVQKKVYYATGRGKEYIPKQVTYHKYDPMELKKYLQNGGDINNLSESIANSELIHSEMNQLKQIRDYLINDINNQKAQSFHGGRNSNDNLKAIFDNEASPTTSVSVNFKDILRNITNKNKNLKGGQRKRDNFVEEPVTETFDLDDENDENEDEDEEQDIDDETNQDDDSTQNDYSETSNNESEGLMPFYSENGSDYEFRQATHPYIRNRFT